MTSTEIAQKMYAFFAVGDLNGVLGLLAEDVRWELIGPSSIPYFGLYEGRSGVEKFFSKLFEHEEILLFEPKKFITEGDDVVVIGHESARSRATGKVFETTWVQVLKIENGLIASWTEYIDSAAIDAAYSDK